jgi:ribosome-binding protein aMBF1 (putative translation factor)
MRRPATDDGLDLFIEIDKLLTMVSKNDSQASPKGKSAADAARSRGKRSETYREARDEYAAIRELRQKNWIAAHIRERRFELDLTQKDVAGRAKTSHSFISRLERGDHIPTIPVLQRILAVLDEELLIGIERHVHDEEPEREVAPVPKLTAA